MAESASELLMLLFRNDYVKSTIIFLFFLVLAYVALSLLKTIFASMAKKTTSKVDDEIVERLDGPVTFFLACIGLKFAVIPLEFDEGIKVILNHVINTILVVILTYIFVVLADLIVTHLQKKHKAEESKQMRTIFPLIRRFVTILFGTLGFLFIMLEWEVQVGPFLASLGLLGLAVSLALKDSLANVFGGISLILDKNFNVGDYIKLDSGEVGKVVDIGLRSTKFVTFDNETMMMPNSLLANMKLLNFAKPDPTHRVEIVVPVEYSADPLAVKKVLLDAIGKLRGMAPGSVPYVRFRQMADYYLEFKCYFFVPSFEEKYEMEDQALTEIWYSLKRNKIGIPYPTRTIFMENAKKH